MSVRLAAAVFIVSALVYNATAHDVYSNWKNGKDQSCCHNLDCRSIPESDERTVRGHLQVLVEGQWCPVLEHHYLKTGNAANPEFAHVCVRQKTINMPDLTPCQRLLCYQPRPLS